MRLISLGLGVDLGFQFRMSSSSQHSSRTWPRVAKTLDESVRSKTVEVEALQGVVAQLQRQNRNLKVSFACYVSSCGSCCSLANITSDLVVA
ncbi:hypothetical protein SASPL_157135 [Salvia splendens]|uniref:Uncharacterized protein n=1 Tax=Salvia splendens TaxID=180675 RepID=A0A8X8YUQ3_SALSN|nr:hypothetical protein SASPL_157135 [Salvia splendens]